MSAEAATVVANVEAAPEQVEKPVEPEAVTGAEAESTPPKIVEATDDQAVVEKPAIDASASEKTEKPATEEDDNEPVVNADPEPAVEEKEANDKHDENGTEPITTEDAPVAAAVNGEVKGVKRGAETEEEVTSKKFKDDVTTEDAKSELISVTE